MSFSVRYDEKALRQLKKLDSNTQRLITSWVASHLVGTDNPRLHGKALSGNMKEYWRYRVADYRIVADIRDEEVLILIVRVKHRRDVYKR